MKKITYCIFIFALIASCKKSETTIDYRQEMRNFVQKISAVARAQKPGFIIIPQNGHELLTTSGKPDASFATAYIQAIDGIGREDLFYGYDNDDVATKAADRDEMLPYMDIAKNNNLKVLVTDYCSTQSKMLDANVQNSTRGYLSFAADHRELDNIPAYPDARAFTNTNDINTLQDARNFLYIINTQQYESKAGFLNAVGATNYDVVVMDLNFNDEFFTADEINGLKHKANGGLRKIICYMSIGEAEDYRYYWPDFWHGNAPGFVVAENSQWAGNYKVKYWDKDWQNIICGNGNSYTSRVINAGFDGVYLDIIDGFEYFED